jgi:acetylornithine deacetylase/succinyl-diaminopimelate desuccinylase-like protein
MTPRRSLSALLLAVVLTSAVPVRAQQTYPTNFSRQIAEAGSVRKALDWIESNFEAQVEEWIRLTEIPSKSGSEAARAAYLVEQIRRQGLDVEIDEAGNVVARWPGTGGGPTVVFGAHMDTVHPLDTDVTVTRDGDILRAPGIFDNSASVANMMAVIRALRATDVRTRGDLIFVATVEEELGFNGMDAWLDANDGVADVVVALDGGLGGVSYGALWFAQRRYIFSGEGSHTLSSRGKPHPARALSAAIASIYEIPLPDGGPFAVYNVGMLGGGLVTNAIPQETWFTVDLRSVEPALIDQLDAELDRRVALAAERHGVEWRRDPPSSPSAVVAARPMLPEVERRSHPLVQTMIDIYAHLGIDAPARDTGSTDAVAAVRKGIPAIAIGRSRGGDQHTLSEWAHVPSALTATQAVLLVAVSMAGLPAM